MTTSTTATYVPPGLFRRLAAGFYDLLLVIALWFPATAIALAIFQNDRHLPEVGYRVYLLAIAFAFFGWFWTHGGQTLGMRAWRLKLVTGTGAPPGWHQALVRYVSMLIPWLLIGLGLEFIMFPAAHGRWLFQDVLAPLAFLAALTGFVWPRLDRRRLAWHDRLSASCLTVLPKVSRKSGMIE
ncbi:MAG TPA: RDD family protein [Gammaproteobacteria bacterium]|nr:RDD family protein [Gammaproteobacteria bacterium]